MGIEIRPEEKTILPMFLDLSQILLDMETDLRKFENGNKAAGMRARKKLQELRFKAKDIRAEIQRLRVIHKRRRRKITRRA